MELAKELKETKTYNRKLKFDEIKPEKKVVEAVEI